MTEKEVSEFLKIPVQTLRNNRSRGKGIPCYKIGKHVRYKKAELLEYLDTQKIDPKP